MLKFSSGIVQIYKISIRWGRAHTQNISLRMKLSQNNLFLQDEGLEAESKVEISFKSQVS